MTTQTIHGLNPLSGGLLPVSEVPMSEPNGQFINYKFLGSDIDSRATAQIVNVGKNGSNTTGVGTGSALFPFASASKAMTSITDASSSKPYIISVQPGNYTNDTSLPLKRFVGIQGNGHRYNSLQVQSGDSSITLDSTSWTSASSGNLLLSGFSVLNDSGVLLNFALLGATSSNVQIDDLFISGASGLQVTGNDTAGHEVDVSNTTVVGAGATFDGNTSTLNTCNFETGLNIVSVNGNGTISTVRDCTASSCYFSASGSGGNIVVVTLLGSPNLGTITINGTGVTVYYDPVSFSVPTLTGGALSSQFIALVNISAGIKADNALYVSANGVSSGSGAIFNPYDLPSTALSASSPSSNNPIDIVLFPGTYSDTASPFNVSPFVGFLGDPNFPAYLTLSGAGSFTLSSDWDSSTGGILSFQNLNLIDSGFILDFGAASASETTLNINNVSIDSSGTLQITGIDESANNCNINQLNYAASTATLQGVKSNITNSNFTLSLTLTGTSSNTRTFIDTCYIGALNITSSGALSIATVTNSPSIAQINLDGTGSTLFIDTLSLSAIGGISGINLSSGATLAQVTVLDATISSPVTVIPITVSITLDASHWGNRLLFNSGSPITITLPQQSTLATAPGINFTFENANTGDVTFVVEGTETLTGNTLCASLGSGSVWRDTTTDWWVEGGTSILTASVEYTIDSPGNNTYAMARMPVAGTFTNFYSTCQAGSSTVEFFSLNSSIDQITSAELPVGIGINTVAATGNNTFVVGDYLQANMIDNSGCTAMLLSAVYTYRMNI